MAVAEVAGAVLVLVLVFVRIGLMLTVLVEVVLVLTFVGAVFWLVLTVLVDVVLVFILARVVFWLVLVLVLVGVVLVLARAVFWLVLVLVLVGVVLVLVLARAVFWLVLVLVLVGAVLVLPLADVVLLLVLLDAVVLVLPGAVTAILVPLPICPSALARPDNCFWMLPPSIPKLLNATTLTSARTRPYSARLCPLGCDKRILGLILICCMLKNVPTRLIFFLPIYQSALLFRISTDQNLCQNS